MPWKVLIIDNNNGQGPSLASRIYDTTPEAEARMAQEAQEFIDRGASVVAACVLEAVGLEPAPAAEGTESGSV